MKRKMYLKVFQLIKNKIEFSVRPNPTVQPCSKHYTAAAAEANNEYQMERAIFEI
jgi:hypothetical protein